MNFFGSKQKKKTTPMIPFSEFSASREKRERPERKKQAHPFLLPGILWVVFFCTLGYFLFFSQETEVQDISFIGNETVSSKTLETITYQVMQGKYFSVFPKNNFFFLSRDALIQNIRDVSPKIQSVTVERIFPSKVMVIIQERPIVILWRSADGDFLLDESGSVSRHAELSSVASSPFSFVVHDEIGREIKAGDIVMEESTPLFIGKFVEKFENRFKETLSHEIWVPSRFSGELLFHVEEGFDILLDSHFKSDDILTTLQAAMERGIIEEDRNHLSRIDLRTENRVYYTLDAENNGQGAVSKEQETDKASEKKKK